MKWLDFLFWHYYSFIERQNKKNNGVANNKWMAIILIDYTLSFTFGAMIGGINTFIIDLNLPKYRSNEERLLSLICGGSFLLFLWYRYCKKKSIVNNNYELFRERWGEPLQVSKKNMRILLIYTIITTIGMFLYVVIMGEFNRRGMFDGYRLFP